MSDLPDPPLPGDVDLRDFAFMPLDVVRLRDSDLAAVPDGEVFRAAVLAWCAAWHQVPAASLPDEDPVLARLLGYGRDVKGWKKLRDAGALKGFVLCSDGRLYHDVVAEKARDAWTGKLRQRWSTECARIKKHNERHGTDIPRPEFEEWKSAGCLCGQRLPVPSDKSDVASENPSKGQGEGQGYRQGQGEKKQSAAAAPPPPEPPRLAEPKPTPSTALSTSPVQQDDLLDLPPSLDRRKASRLSPDWELPDVWRQWAEEERPDLDVHRVAAMFKDFWIGKSGKDATKTDWFATFRNWVRREAGGPKTGKSATRTALENI